MKMSSNQLIIFLIFVGYLALNAVIGIIFGKCQDAKGNLSSEKKYFIGGRSMGGLVLAMTTMATYTSVSSFVSGPGAAGLTYGYAQVWVAAVQVPVTFLVLGVLGNKAAVWQVSTRDWRRIFRATMISFPNMHRADCSATGYW